MGSSVPMFMPLLRNTQRQSNALRGRNIAKPQEGSKPKSMWR